MDIFSTAATCCNIIYQILDASSSFPSESRSLAARFKYDARILRHFCEYFENQRTRETTLSEEDQALLEDSASYLGLLVKRVEVCKTKLEVQSRWAKEVNRLTWLLRRNEVRELEKELYEWTKRLDLRLVALPERARAVMRIGEEEEVQNFTPRLAARTRLERFAAQAATAKKAIWEQLIVDCSQVHIKGDSRMLPFSSGIFQGRTALLEFRALQIGYDELGLKSKQAELGEFAAALNYLDSSISGLPKCIGFFYESTLSPRFGLIYQLPTNAGGNFASFKEVIAATDSNGRRMKLRHSLNHRLEFARKLATAVFFVHSIGWVHKAIRSQNILLLGEEPKKEDGNEPTSLKWALHSPSLVGFEVARSNEGETNPGARSKMPLEIGLYMHPDLQRNDTHVRHTMAHDVYSLGIVLLELGIWAPLDKRRELRPEMTLAETGAALLRLANETELLMGRRYREVVQLCLSQSYDGDPGNFRSISEVLEKLEDLAQSV